MYHPALPLRQPTADPSLIEELFALPQMQLQQEQHLWQSKKHPSKNFFHLALGRCVWDFIDYIRT